MSQRKPVHMLDPEGAADGEGIVVAGGVFTVGALPTPPVPTQSINAQTGTTYTLVLADAESVVTVTNAAPATVTIPPNASVAFPIGVFIEVHQLGAGQVTLAAGSGVTVNATPGLKIAAQHGVAGLRKIATDTWQAFGRLAA